MLLRKSHKRLYYTSGLISLLLLPVLCVLYLQNTKVFEPLYTIELNAWTHEQSSIWKKSGYDYDIHPKRNFIDISLKGNDTEDKIKLDFVQLQMRDLIKSNDTVSGIHIVFGNQSKYWELIETLNICIKEKARTYVLVGNDFWFFNFYPKPIKKNDNYVTYKIETAGFCGTSEHQCVPTKVKESNLIFSRSLNALYFSLSVLFLLMCWFTFNKIKTIKV